MVHLFPALTKKMVYPNVLSWLTCAAQTCEPWYGDDTTLPGTGTTAASQANAILAKHSFAQTQNTLECSNSKPDKVHRPNKSSISFGKYIDGGECNVSVMNFWYLSTFLLID